MLTGHTSGLILIFQAGQAAGLAPALITSWIWALSLGMAVCTIGLSLRYRAPIVVAWSTPGAALLISSLPGVSFGAAIGAYLVCALLLTLVGLTGSFERKQFRFADFTDSRTGERYAYDANVFQIVVSGSF